MTLENTVTGVAVWVSCNGAGALKSLRPEWSPLSGAALGVQELLLFVLCKARQVWGVSGFITVTRLLCY